MAQHANPVQQLLLARRFRKEIDVALSLDPKDVQAWRDLVEYYLLAAPGIAGGDLAKAATAAKQHRSTTNASRGISRLGARGLLLEGRNRSLKSLLQRVHLRQSRPVTGRELRLRQFYLDEHRSAEAETQARDAIRLDPTRVDAYRILAQILPILQPGTSSIPSLWRQLLTSAGQSLPPGRYYRAGERLIAGGATSLNGRNAICLTPI